YPEEPAQTVRSFPRRLLLGRSRGCSQDRCEKRRNRHNPPGRLVEFRSIQPSFALPASLAIPDERRVSARTSLGIAPGRTGLKTLRRSRTAMPGDDPLGSILAGKRRG